MKKIICAVAMAMVACMTFAQTSTTATDNKVEQVVKTITKEAEKVPSGTTYGIVSKTKDHYVVNTPLGEYKVKRENGGVRFMGIWGKLDNKKKGVYNISTSFGRYSIDTNKGTITKR